MTRNDPSTAGPMLPAGAGKTGDGPFSRRPLVWAWLAAVAAGLVAFGLGAASDLSLGDEAYHYRKALTFYQAGERLTYDPAYGPVMPPGIPYCDGPAWHAGLAALWRVTGQSILAAQAYQAAWFVLLVGFAFMAGRRLVGERAGWWSLLATATLPGVFFFSALLYIEVAMMALLMLAIVLLLKQRPLLAGLVFGLAFLFKPTAAVAYPAFLFGAILTAQAAWRPRLAALIWAGLGTALVVIPELVWRQIHFGTIGIVYLSQSGGDAAIPDAIREMIREKALDVFYQPSSLASPRDVVMYLGAPAAIGLLLSLLLIRKMPRRSGAALWAVALAYAAAHVVLVVQNPSTLDVRYAMAAFPLLMLMAGPALAHFTSGRRWIAALLIVLALAQATAVGATVLKVRRVDPETMAALRELKMMAPGFAVSPEYVTHVYGGKPIIWAGINPGAFFFKWSPEKQWRLLDYFGVEYIVIPESRVYDDAVVEPNTGGYPKSYVDRLPTMPYVDPKPVIDRGGLRVYLVKPMPKNAAAQADPSVKP